MKHYKVNRFLTLFHPQSSPLGLHAQNISARETEGSEVSMLPPCNQLSSQCGMSHEMYLFCCTDQTYITCK